MRIENRLHDIEMSAAYVDVTIEFIAHVWAKKTLGSLKGLLGLVSAKQFLVN
jgi:hypothetical protein